MEKVGAREEDERGEGLGDGGGWWWKRGGGVGAREGRGARERVEVVGRGVLDEVGGGINEEDSRGKGTTEKGGGTGNS